MSEALPMDVTEIILSRLPVKSLLRIKCVKREWYTLITDVRFSKNLVNRSVHKMILTEVGLLMLPSSESNSNDHARPTELLSDNLGANKFSRIIGSSNGLLCIIHSDENNITLLNPFTRKFKEMPFPIKKYQPSFSSNEGEDYNRYGFWYNEAAKDYKIIILENPITSVYNIVVHTIGTKSWRIVCKNIGYYVSDFCNIGILVDDVLHWLVCSPTDFLIVVAFDCMKNNVYQLSLPSKFAFTVFSTYLTMLGSQLCVISRNVSVFDAWVMEEHGCPESWVKKYTINQPEYVDVHSDSFRFKWKPVAELLLDGQKTETMTTFFGEKYLKDDSQVYRCMEGLASVEINK